MKRLLLIVTLLLASSLAYAGSGYLAGGNVTITTHIPTFQCFTGASYDGDQTDYATVDDLCIASCAGSHVCRVDEILYMVNSDAGTLPITGDGWINGGPPGYTANANDCQGWSTNALSNYGRYWDFATKQGWMRGCVNALPFACCK